MLLKFVISTFVFSVCHSCSCQKPTITRSYCRADLVAHVRAVNVTIYGKDQQVSGSEYAVKYIEIFKKTNSYYQVNKKNVFHTPPTGGLCGVLIKPNSNTSEWLLFGEVINNEISIDICDANQPWVKNLKGDLQGLTKFNCTSL